MDATRSETDVTNDTRADRRSERELVVTRVFDGPARLVFDAWTKPELLMRWWAPKSFGITFLSCEADVRPGGTYKFVFGHPQSDEPMAFVGRYIEDKTNSSFDGHPFEGRGITGYDNMTHKYTFTWIDNMGTGFMTGEGNWDPATKSFKFETMSPNVMTGEQMLRDGLVEPRIERLVQRCVLPPEVVDARRQRGVLGDHPLDLDEPRGRQPAVDVGVEIGVGERKRIHRDFARVT